MSTLRFAFVLSLLLSALPSWGAESTPAPKQAPPPMTETRDAFLAFALEKAKTYSDKAELAVSKAVDVVSKEVPEALREFLIWRTWLHGAKALGPVLLCGFGVLLFYKHWPRFSFDSFGRFVAGSLFNVLCGIVGLAAGVVGLIMVFVISLSNLMSFIQLLVAPRVYVIEQVMHLFRK